MSHLKRDKKKEVVKPSDDCSCTSTDTSSSDCTEKHEKYDEHCEVKKHEGKTHCRRKCRTICVVECEKEVNFKYEWCYKTKEDHKWGPIHPENVPKKCDDRKPHDDKKPDDKKH